MKANLDNPIIAHKKMSLELSEHIEQKRQNKIFQLLLLKFKKEHKEKENNSDAILRYKNYLAYQR